MGEKNSLINRLVKAIRGESKVTLNNDDVSQKDKVTLKNTETGKEVEPLRTLGVIDKGDSYEVVIARNPNEVEKLAKPLEELLSVSDQSADYPVKAGKRRSTFSGFDGYGSEFTNQKLETPPFDRRLYDLLDYLVIFNPDMSYAMDNIVQLSSTNLKVEYDSGVSIETQRAMNAHMATRLQELYWTNNSQTSLVTDLFAQLASSGALSAEAYPNITFKGIEEIVLLHPREVYWYNNKDKNKMEPWQRDPRSPDTTRPGYTRLNQNTYRYLPLRRLNANPYGVPPFLSAIEHTKLENDMLANLSSITSKIGAFGFLKVSVKKPKDPTGGTNKDLYDDLCNTLLDNVEAEVSKGFAEGHCLGFKDEIDFEILGQPSNIQGSEALFNLVNTLKISGLKQDPLMLGRNFSTTEAIGRVILTKLSEQIDNYQAVVANFLHFVYELELRLAGFKFKTLKLTFDKPLVADVKKEEEAYGKKIDNNTKLYMQGIISQSEYANRLGFEAPDQLEPRGPVAVGTAYPYPEKNDKKKAGTDTAKQSLHVRVNRNSFSYGAVPNNTSEELAYYIGSYAVLDSDMAKWMKEYTSKVSDVYYEMADYVSEEVYKKLKKEKANQALDEVEYFIMSEIVLGFREKFAGKANDLVLAFIPLMYASLKDTKIKGNKSWVEDSDSDFVNYFVKSDVHYLSSIISDVDTVTRLTDFIATAYAAGAIPNELSDASFEDFKVTLRNTIEAEEWKINRILNTTINRLRNTAKLKAFNQLGIKEYFIKGVSGPKQCSYCKAMQGKKFSVVTAIATLGKVINTAPERVSSVTPFINTVFTSADQISAVDIRTLENLGLNLPPFHTHCVDIVVEA